MDSGREKNPEEKNDSVQLVGITHGQQYSMQIIHPEDERINTPNVQYVQFSSIGKMTLPLSSADYLTDHKLHVLSDHLVGKVMVPNETARIDKKAFAYISTYNLQTSKEAILVLPPANSKKTECNGAQIVRQLNAPDVFWVVIYDYIQQYTTAGESIKKVGKAISLSSSFTPSEDTVLSYHKDRKNFLVVAQVYNDSFAPHTLLSLIEVEVGSGRVKKKENCMWHQYKGSKIHVSLTNKDQIIIIEKPASYKEKTHYTIHDINTKDFKIVQKAEASIGERYQAVLCPVDRDYLFKCTQDCISAETIAIESKKINFEPFNKIFFNHSINSDRGARFCLFPDGEFILYRDNSKLHLINKDEKNPINLNIECASPDNIVFLNQRTFVVVSELEKNTCLNLYRAIYAKDIKEIKRALVGVLGVGNNVADIIADYSFTLFNKEDHWLVVRLRNVLAAMKGERGNAMKVAGTDTTLDQAFREHDVAALEALKKSISLSNPAKYIECIRETLENKEISNDFRTMLNVCLNGLSGDNDNRVDPGDAKSIVNSSHRNN